MLARQPPFRTHAGFNGAFKTYFWLAPSARSWPNSQGSGSKKIIENHGKTIRKPQENSD